MSVSAGSTIADLERSGLLAASDEERERGPAIRQASVGRAREGRVWKAAKLALTAGAAAGAAVLLLQRGGTSGMAQKRLIKGSVEALIQEAMEQDPNWGCGLVGALPGVTQEGHANTETQRLIDGIKGASTFKKVSYWNWNLAPQTEEGEEQHLTSEFIFMPEQWGVGPVEAKYVRQAGEANFQDSNGKPCPATMGEIFLGSNEPDIIGSCMGDMFGECKKSCSPAAVASGDCPAAHLHGPQNHANSQGECNCWQFSHATGAGFWPVKGCSGDQPLPQMWEDPACIDTIMAGWKQTAATAVSKGYKYLTTPLVAENMDYAKDFLEKACSECHDASCGCPVYVAFHFYAYDCQPEALGGYETFQKRLDAVKDIMEAHSFVKGAIINEVGMLNCAGEADNPICVPNSGTYPATDSTSHACPANKELPDGLATFIEKLFDMVIDAKTSDGRSVVKGFSWFNENMAGGTYNLQLFDGNGKLNQVGEAYIKGCSRWGAAQSAATA